MFKNNKKTDFTRNFAILYLLHFMTASLIMSQRMTYLIRIGYSIQKRSLIFAAVPLVSIALQFLISYLSDKFHTIKKVYVISLVFSAFFAYIFYSVSVQLYVYHFIITLLSNSLILSTEQLSDVWVLESKGASKNKYSYIRAFGSAGWAIGSFLLAQIVLRFGYAGLANVSLILNILVMATVLTINDDKAIANKNESKVKIKLSDVKVVFKNHSYLLAIMIMFFIRFADAMCGYILIDKMLSLGGSEWHISIRYIIAASVEIPVLLVGDFFYKKLGGIKMIFISLIAYTLKFFGYYLAQSNTLIFWVTGLQAIALPFFIVAIKYILFDLSPKHLKSVGQISGPAIVDGIQGVLHPLAVALLLTVFTVDSPLLLATILALFAILLNFLLLKQYRKIKTQEVLKWNSDLVKK